MIKKTLTAAAVAGSALLLALGAASPALAAPGDNLIENGNFDAPGMEGTQDGVFWLGDNYAGWEMTDARVYGDGSSNSVMRIYYPGMGEPGEPFGEPYSTGPWAALTGEISQNLVTEPGKTYRVSFESRASAWGPFPDSGSTGWAGGNPGIVLIDGVQVFDYMTVADPEFTLYEFVFDATSTTTEISFGVIQGRGAVGLDSVSVTEVPVDDSPIMVPAIAGGLGIAGLAAGGTVLIKRKNKRNVK